LEFRHPLLKRHILDTHLLSVGGIFGFHLSFESRLVVCAVFLHLLQTKFGGHSGTGCVSHFPRLSLGLLGRISL
jgi:hypothetical protein